MIAEPRPERKAPFPDGREWLAFAGALLATLAALALLLWRLSDLNLRGDSAYSVSVALQPLPVLTAGRALDGHPPLYYYLLYAWLRTVGVSELTARLPAVFASVLLVPTTYRLVRSLAGPWPALVAAWLVALSPDLIFHGRLARMYSLMPLAVAVSWLLFQRASRRGGRAWVWHAVATTVALYSHYYALLGVAGQGLYLLWRWRGGVRRSGLASLLVAGLLFVPWLLWAVPTQAPTTAAIIGNAAPAQGLLGFVEQAWLPFQVGVLVDVETGREVAGAMALLCLTAFALNLGRLARLGSALRPLLVATLTPLVLSLGVFAVSPIAVRPRFLLVAVPFFLMTLGVLLASVRPRALAAALFAVVLAVDGFSMFMSYPTERALFEEDSVQIAELLDRWGRPGDVAVFHAGWEIGYLRAHLPSTKVDLLDLEEVAQPYPESLARYRRVWVAAYKVAPSQLELGASLSATWGKVEEWRLGPTNLVLFVAPPAAVKAPLDQRFVDPSGDSSLTLVAVTTSRLEAPAGEDVVVALDWAASVTPRNRLKSFVHLVSDRGDRIFGVDREIESWGGRTGPGAGSAGVGATVRHAFRVPLDLPSGDYRLVAGLYPASGGGPVHVAGQPDAERVDVARLRVTPPTVRPARTLDVLLGGDFQVTGLTTDLDRFVVDHTLGFPVLANEALPLVFRKTTFYPGETAQVDLHWRSSQDLKASSPLVLRAIPPSGKAIDTPANRPIAGPSGVASFTLRWPDDASSGAYGLYAVLGDRAELLGQVPVTRGGR